MVRVFLGALCLVTSCAGFAQQKPVSAAVSDADAVTIAELVDPIFQLLKAGDAKGAVNGFLGKSLLFSGRNAELENLVSQIETTNRIYGPISNCVFAELEERGGVVQQRLYLCQHRDYLTRWKVTIGKSALGWVPMSLLFDDQVMSEL